MHDTQRIREAFKARLDDQVGTDAPGGIHAGRAGGLFAGEPVPLILIDVFQAHSEIFSEESHAEAVTYVAEIALVCDGPAPDLADGRPPCCDVVDALALKVRRALKRGWALGGGFQVPGTDGVNRLIDFRFGDSRLVTQAGGAGVVAHLTLRYPLTVVCEDGDPSFD